MGRGHRQSDGVAGTLDLVGHQRNAELLDQGRPVDVPGDGELARGNAFDHFTADVNRTVRRASDERAADPELGLHPKAGKILPGELRRRQRLPDLLRGGGDVDGVDNGRLEVIDVHSPSNPSIPSAEGGIASAVPDSSVLLRLDRITGQPLEMPSRCLLPSAKPSWVNVSFTNLPCRSRLNTTLDGRSLRAASLRTCWEVADRRRGGIAPQNSAASVG